MHIADDQVYQLDLQLVASEDTQVLGRAELHELHRPAIEHLSGPVGRMDFDTRPFENEDYVVRFEFSRIGRERDVVVHYYRGYYSRKTGPSPA